jgi:8-oxo-dGTP diphosphatase
MQRIAAYALCRRDEHILLARWVSPDGVQRHWTLPGGRVEHGEDPYDTVVREVREETGYDTRVDALLGVSSRIIIMDYSDPPGAEMHAVSIFYEAAVTGGTLRDEIGGSTDLARWVPLTQVPALERAVIVDTGIALYRDRPPTGRTPSAGS